MNRYKILPFNEAALSSLKNAQEKLRALSEMIFNFIQQDEEEMLLTLTNNKLIGFNETK